MDTWVEGGLEKDWGFYGQPHFKESAPVPSLGLGAACRLGIRPSSTSEVAPTPSALEVAPAPLVIPETASAVPSESATGTDCNKEAAAP